MRALKVRGKDKFIQVTVIRQNGCDGIVKCKYETLTPDSINTPANPYEDYLPKSGVLVFNHGETEKEIEIEILPKETHEVEERADVFAVRIFDPEGGVKISKKDISFIEIVGDNELLTKVKGIQEMLEMLQQNENKTWASQFKQAVILSPQIDEEGNIDDVSALEALLTSRLSAGSCSSRACRPRACATAGPPSPRRSA